MTRPIGYYVHHHGEGHRQRALALAAAGDRKRFVLLGTGLNGRSGDVGVVDLPDDRMPDAQAFNGIDGTALRPLALHYAPLDHDGVRIRMGKIASWIADARPALMVIDVSVEVAMLARLCSTPVAFMRLSGRRDDAAHCEAYRAASLLIAPFAQPLDDPKLPPWVRESTVYCPGIVGQRRPTPEPTPHSVLVVGGRGGAPQDGARIALAAAATPSYRWRVIGPATPPGPCPSNLVFAGWTENALADIATSEVVIGAAGDGLVNAVIATKRPFICCPEPRPFDEQVQKARALKSAGAAVIIAEWPAADRWPALLAAAARLDRIRLMALGDPDGSAKTRALLDAFANAQK